MNTDFGKCIREILRENNELIIHLSEGTGFSPSDISAMMHGNTYIDVGFIYSVSGYFKLSVFSENLLHAYADDSNKHYMRGCEDEEGNMTRQERLDEIKAKIKEARESNDLDVTLERLGEAVILLTIEAFGEERVMKDD